MGSRLFLRTLNFDKEHLKYDNEYYNLSEFKCSSFIVCVHLFMNMVTVRSTFSKYYFSLGCPHFLDIKCGHSELKMISEAPAGVTHIVTIKVLFAGLDFIEDRKLPKIVCIDVFMT